MLRMPTVRAWAGGRSRQKGGGKEKERTVQASPGGPPEGVSARRARGHRLPPYPSPKDPMVEECCFEHFSSAKF
eukprot:9481603-Pyramimonas_sp.AAC.1